MGNKVGLRVDSDRNLYVEALVYEIKGKKVNISSKSKYFTFMYIKFILYHYSLFSILSIYNL